MIRVQASATVMLFAALVQAEAIRPTEVVPLFNGKNLEGWNIHLQESGAADPKGVFRVNDGMLHVSGDGLGYLATADVYRDYRLVTEFRWGKKTWPPREKAARDSGVLVHATGEDGNAGPWKSSIEAQIIEGGVGDIIVIPGKNKDGTTVTPSVTAKVTADRDGEPVWDARGSEKAFTSGRVNWFGRDPDWRDTIDFRGKRDLESPFGEWTRMEVIADGANLHILVNGTLVNEATAVSPSAGQILLQTECAEIVFRKVELHPLTKP